MLGKGQSVTPVTNQLVISGWWRLPLTPSANQEPARTPEVIEEIVRLAVT